MLLEASERSAPHKEFGGLKSEYDSSISTDKTSEREAFIQAKEWLEMVTEKTGDPTSEAKTDDATSSSETKIETVLRRMSEYLPRLDLECFDRILESTNIIRAIAWLRDSAEEYQMGSNYRASADKIDQGLNLIAYQMLSE